MVWHKDGVELGPGHKYDFLHTAGMRGLVVHDLSQNDAGLYTCRVGSEETRSVVSVHGACVARQGGSGRDAGAEGGTWAWDRLLSVPPAFQGQGLLC